MSNLRLNFEKSSVGRISATLQYVSASKYEGDWNSILHNHPFAELFYVIHGKGTFTVENETFEVNEDDFIIVNPNMMHTENSIGDSPLEYIVMGVGGLAFLFGEDQSYCSHSVHNYRAHRKDFLFYLSTLVKELERQSKDSEIICQDLFEVLLITMMRNAHFSFAVSGSQKSGRESSIAKHYIDSNFKESITLDDLANLTHTNKYYLAHSFTKNFGVSPISYLLNKRIEESKTLLETANYSVAQIAQIVGFSSPSYFSQAFARATSQTPNQYRKQIRLAKKSES